MHFPRKAAENHFPHRLHPQGCDFSCAAHEKCFCLLPLLLPVSLMNSISEDDVGVAARPTTRPERAGGTAFTCRGHAGDKLCAVHHVG